MKVIPELEDIETVNRAQAGNVDAFGDLVECYQSQIIRYCYRMTGDTEIARDLAQDTFLRVYKSLSKTTPDSPFKTWLYRIATNNVLQYRRKKRSLPSLRPMDNPGLEAALQSVNTLNSDAEIQDILLRIPAKFRICMVLHFVDGFKYREIGQMLGISEDAVRMRVARGSEDFRKRFDTGGGDAK